MRIIRNGYLADEGIIVTCPCCKCEFILEDRNDFESKHLVGLGYSGIKLPSYNFECPQCRHPFSFGIDPDVYEKTFGKFWYNPYEIIFKRDDWKERFEVE